MGVVVARGVEVQQFGITRVFVLRRGPVEILRRVVCIAGPVDPHLEIAGIPGAGVIAKGDLRVDGLHLLAGQSHEIVNILCPPFEPLLEMLPGEIVHACAAFILPGIYILRKPLHRFAQIFLKCAPREVREVGHDAVIPDPVEDEPVEAGIFGHHFLQHPQDMLPEGGLDGVDHCAVFLLLLRDGDDLPCGRVDHTGPFGVPVIDLPPVVKVVTCHKNVEGGVHLEAQLMGFADEITQEVEGGVAGEALPLRHPGGEGALPEHLARDGPHVHHRMGETDRFDLLQVKVDGVRMTQRGEIGRGVKPHQRRFAGRSRRLLLLRCAARQQKQGQNKQENYRGHMLVMI